MCTEIENDLAGSFQRPRNDGTRFGIALVMVGLVVICTGYVVGAVLAGTPTDDFLVLLVVDVFAPVNTILLLLVETGEE